LVSEADPAYRVERVHFSSLSVADFRRHVHDERRTPLIITGLGPHIAPGGFCEASLRRVLPDGLGLPVRGHGTLAAADFFRRFHAGDAVYVADVPVARHCPWLFNEFSVPRYFLHCYSHRTRRALSIAYDTPAFFVGAASTASGLHVDQMRSNFWMYVGEGYKHWITFHPDDAPLLSPAWDDAEQIDRFRPLAQLGADAAAAAAMGRARRLEFTLCEGETLYIPRGTPHEVTNLCATAAVSANFIDGSNLHETLTQGRAKLQRRDAGSERARNLRGMLDALDEIDFPELDDDVAAEERAPLPGEQMVGSFPLHERLKSSRPVQLCGVGE
jgi:hypothetical protein